LGTTIAHDWNTTFTCQVFNDRAPIASPIDDPEIRRFLSVYGQSTSREGPHGIAPYSTDAVAIVPGREIPLVIYGPGQIEQAHQPNEFLDKAQLDEALRVIGRFVGL
jgi:acetylornithine deacetylase/succinyl-diaminopimelate desuccinylase-like protein